MIWPSTPGVTDALRARALGMPLCLLAAVLSSVRVEGAWAVGDGVPGFDYRRWRRRVRVCGACD